MSKITFAAWGLGIALLGGGIALAAEAPDYLHWPKPTGVNAKYAAIDGHRLHTYVEEQARIAERYRDAGHPQFWGRISGTSGDAEAAQWLEKKFAAAGLSDTRIQTVKYLAPQWAPKSWSVSLTDGTSSVPLSSAQPSYASPDTGAKEIDLEIVSIGAGGEDEFANKDVRGKAVLLLKTSLSRQIGPQDVLKRIEAHGAAAILSTDLRGGNFTAQSYKAYTHVPTFHLGTRDGEAIRAMIGKEGAAAHVKIRMEAGHESGQKSFLVWGTLPGMTDETIYVIAHRDGWFDAAGDNASGVASMIGLAEYFAKLPKSQRQRTLVFIGGDGHHSIRPGEFGNEWIVANRARLFAKTALIINSEHPSVVQTHGNAAGWTDTMTPLEWFAGGPDRPQLQKLFTDAFRTFGVPLWTQPSKVPPAGDLGRFYWFLPGVVAQSNDFIDMHTLEDTPANVPWTGLEGVTRAYAKLIDDVNKVPLKDLQRPAMPDPNAKDSAENVNLAKCAAWVQDSTKGCEP